MAILHTVKAVLSGLSKLDKTKVFKSCGSLMREHSAVLLTCIKQLSNLKTISFVFFEWRLKTGFTIILLINIFSTVLVF